MRIALLSDVHGNLEALESVLQRIREIKPDAIICLGDVVGYGPNPNETARLCSEVSNISVLGNHDYAIVRLWNNPKEKRKILDRFNPISRKAIQWTLDAVNEETVNLLARTGLEVVWKDLHIVHASPGFPLDWIYIFTVDEAQMFIPYVKGWAAVVGHTHVPAIFTRTIRGIMHIKPQPQEEYVLSMDDIHILNPGGVGQPRDGDPRASFGILDIDASRREATFRVERIEYPIEITAEKIRKAGLPDELAVRLFIGR